MTHPVAGRAWGGGWRLALAAAAALPIVSLFVARGVSPVPLAAALLFALAALRPPDAWLAAVFLAPLGAWTGGAVGFGSSLTEPVVLAFLAGWLVHEAVRAGGTDRVAVAGDRAVRALLGLLAVTVFASLLVRLATHHLTVDFPAPYARALFHHLWHDYFGGPSRFRTPLTPAVRLLAGIALAAASLSLARRDPRLGVRGAGALAAGAVAAALVSLAPLAWSAATMGWSHAFPKGLAAVRVSSVGADVNAAGSFYALTLGVLAGLALHVRRWRALWCLAGLLQLGALWMTGSRAALAATALVAVLSAALAAFCRGRRAASAAATLALGLVVFVGGYLYSTAGVRTATAVALQWRVELGTAALRMFAERPVFGVGVGRFYALSTRYASPTWKDRNNAHNNFLQVLAELGLVGLASLVGLLGVVLRGAWRPGRAPRAGPLRAGLAGGVLAFVITWLAGHPLLVLEAGTPFWATLGLLAGLSSPPAGTPREGARPGGPERWRRTAPWIAATLILLSVLPRARAEIRGGDWSRAFMGGSSVHTDARGQRFRWMARRAQMFVPAGSREVAIPFRSPNAPAAIKVFVDGKCVARLVAGRRWTEAAFELAGVKGRASVPIELRADVLTPGGQAGRLVPPPDKRVQVGLPRLLR